MANNSTIAKPDFSPYFYTEFASAIYLSILSPITVAANGLLLAAIYKDPLKCFRTPVTYFIVGLALVDLLTGLAVEPFFAAYYFVRFYNGIYNIAPSLTLLATIAAFISTVGLSLSFLIVLALSCAQYIAITFPHKYKVYITTRRVLAFMIISLVYFTSFSLLQFSNIPKAVFYKVDVNLHATLIQILLMISHFFVFRSFRRFVKKSESIGKKKLVVEEKNDGSHGNGCSNHALVPNPSRKDLDHGGKNKVNQRQLTVATLLLSALLLCCSLPHTLVLYYFLHSKADTHREEVAVNIALRISDAILFLKVLVDPFIYCWRLPKYRMALRNTLMCKKRRTDYSTELSKL